MARKFLGDSYFCTDCIKVEVSRAIFRSPNELVVEFTENDWLYTVPLRRNGDDEDFQTTWTARRRNNNDTHSGDAVCRLYTSKSDVLLFGTWKENNINYQWSLNLDEVECFPDERQD